MKNILFASVFLIGSLGANASVAELGPLGSKLQEAEVNQNKNHFEALGEMFKKGSKPDISKIKNSFSPGRCFFIEDQNYAQSGYFIIIKAKNNEGPLGYNPDAFEAAALYSPILGDLLDDEPISSIWLQTAIEEATYNKVTSAEKSLNILPEKDVINEFRISGEYIVMEAKTNRVSPHWAVFARCYYFSTKYMK